MKIKITLIAFFASALILTSCMKNEASPGIESVREAYAELLSAKAQAELIIANADAAFTLAQAQVQTALAALNQAQAEGQEAANEVVLAQLARDIELWAIQVEAAALAQQQALDAYEAALLATQNALAGTYYNNYVAALLTMRTTQNAIVDMQAAIVALNLDIVNGTTLAYDGLVADLAAANALLTALQGEYAAAEAFLGNVDAIATRLAELASDSIEFMNQKLALLAEKGECTAGNVDLLAALVAAQAADDAPIAAAAAANAAAVYATAVASFEATYPLPAWWVAATTAVTNAQTALNTYDTLTAYNAWKALDDLIAGGTADIDALIVAANDSITLYNDSLAQLVADTVAATAAAAAADATLAAANADTAAFHAQLDVVNDSLTAQRARWMAAMPPGPVPNPDSILTVASQQDSILLTAQIVIGEVACTAATAAKVITDAALVVALADYAADSPAYIAMIAVLDANIVSYNAQRVARLAAIAQAQIDIVDLYSTYLMTLTYVDELEAALQAAIDAKEALRDDYETYMDEFFQEYWDGLIAAATAADAAAATAIAATNAAMAAWAAAEAPCDDIQDDIDALEAQLVFIDAVFALYENALTYQTDYLAGFAAMIAAQQANIVTIQNNIAAAEAAYIAGKINYDKFQEQLTELQAKLVADTNMVAFWKAFLDEAIAAGN